MMPSCAGQARGELRPHLNDHVSRQRAALQARDQVLALEIFHDQERAVVVLDDVVDRGDVGMTDASRRASLAQNLRAGRGRECARRVQTLQCHRPAQSRIGGEEHLTHAAAAEALDDFVGADPIARGQVACLVAHAVDVEEIRPLVVASEHRFDFGAQRRIGTLIAEERVARRRRLQQRQRDQVAAIRQESSSTARSYASARDRCTVR